MVIKTEQTRIISDANDPCPRHPKSMRKITNADNVMTKLKRKYPGNMALTISPARSLEKVLKIDGVTIIDTAVIPPTHSASIKL